MEPLFNDDAGVLHDIVAKALSDASTADAATALFLCFLWKPGRNRPLIVNTARANGKHFVDWRGLWAGQSPTVIELGRYEPGTQVKLEWEVESRSDIAGVRAFVGIDGASRWIPQTPLAPFTKGKLYAGSASVTIPSSDTPPPDSPVSVPLAFRIGREH